MANFTIPHTFHDGTGEPASGAQVSEDFQVLKERLEEIENGANSLLKLAWKALPLTAPWENYNAGAGKNEWFNAEYVKDIFGIVRLRGMLHNTSAYGFGEPGLNRQIGVLPVGFRPQRAVFAIAPQQDSSLNYSDVLIEIATSGAVAIGPSGIGTGNNGSALWLSFDQISFPTT